MLEWGALALKGTKATDQGLMHGGGLGLLGPIVGAGAWNPHYPGLLNSIIHRISWSLWVGEPIPIFHSSITRRLDLPEKVVTGIASEGEELGKLRTVQIQEVSHQ